MSEGIIRTVVKDCDIGIANDEYQYRYVLYCTINWLSCEDVIAFKELISLNTWNQVYNRGEWKIDGFCKYHRIERYMERKNKIYRGPQIRTYTYNNTCCAASHPRGTVWTAAVFGHIQLKIICQNPICVDDFLERVRIT